MSSDPLTQPGGRSIPMHDNPAPLRKRSGCGCLGSISGAIALIFAVTILINPWALHMGGRWTPALVWHGVGKLQSTSGVNYGLFLEVNPFVRHGRRGSGRGTNLTRHGKNLHTARRCVPTDRQRLSEARVAGCRWQTGDVLFLFVEECRHEVEL